MPYTLDWNSAGANGANGVTDMSFDAVAPDCIVKGMTGDDMIGGDTILGGSGDDLVFGFDGHDSLFGHDGNDALNGGAGYDQIFGGPGDDTIWTGEGDSAQGGAGDAPFRRKARWRRSGSRPVFWATAARSAKRCP